MIASRYIAVIYHIVYRQGWYASVCIHSVNMCNVSAAMTALCVSMYVVLYMAKHLCRGGGTFTQPRMLSIEYFTS